MLSCRPNTVTAWVNESIQFIALGAIIQTVIRLEQASGGWIFDPFKSPHWLRAAQKVKGPVKVMQWS